jgi:hypothetical protein
LRLKKIEESDKDYIYQYEIQIGRLVKEFPIERISNGRKT